MNTSQSALALLFLYAFLLGAGLGAFYDVLRITRVFFGVQYSPRLAQRLQRIRLPLLPKRSLRRERRFLGVVVFFQDLAYCIFAGICLVLLFYGANHGKIRPSVLLCVGVGFLLYRATLGRLVMLFSQGIAFAIETAVRYAVFFLLYPVRQLWKVTKQEAKRLWCMLVLRSQKRRRARFTAIQFENVLENGCGMLSEKLSKEQIQKIRREYGKGKKTVQHESARAYSVGHSDRGFPRHFRKQHHAIQRASKRRA
ncbi:MAG: spore cortex biosynthesis protein YabQ [Clostridia bacterium]|nr:spore cortex biosynthesis protein YabQ [Clostridia bacterium]